jgi:3-hydroxy acid dehydrogenase/malonic semialdehyde reductase
MKLKGKIALVTGASNGIGKAIATELASLGAEVILAARRIDRLYQLKNYLDNEYGTESLVVELDVTSEETVNKAITELSGKWANIDILVNNAGLALSSDPIQDGKVINWDRMIDVNVKGLLYVTHAVLPIMLKNNKGHIVNIGSTAGHQTYPGGNVYSATKHAVSAISNSMRIDLLGRHIRVSEIDPGHVGGTEFSTVRWGSQDKANQFYSTFTPLLAEDVADAVVYCVTRKEHVNIYSIVMYSIDQASSNHTYRSNT